MAEILMPKLGLTMTEGLLSEWCVGVGDSYRTGDTLFVVETEKIANEIQAESDGVIAAILVGVGDTVPVGTPVARTGGDDEIDHRAPAAGRSEDNKSSDAAQPEIPDDIQLDEKRPSDADLRVVATPSARRLAREEGVDLQTISGTGPRGRVNPEDVRIAAARITNGEGRVVATPAARRLAKQRGLDFRKMVGTGSNGQIKLRDVQAAAMKSGGIKDARLLENAKELPIDNVRAATARRVSAAKRDIPHFYISRHVEVSALQKLRSELNNQKTLSARISVTHMLAKGLALALVKMPQLNRVWVDDRVLQFDSVDVGIVSETEDGLRIPVLRDVDQSSLPEVAVAAKAVAGRIRSGSLLSSDVGGGSVSISNVGMLGADSLTPIISPPQSMILGVGGEQQLFRPDELGAPKLCNEVILTLACDHRLIDGADAARFLSLLVELLENPHSLLR
ncbi:MAG: 2-oxo acid dehydrogenase subunit E2 [bacterium]